MPVRKGCKGTLEQKYVRLLWNILSQVRGWVKGKKKRTKMKEKCCTIYKILCKANTKTKIEKSSVKSRTENKGNRIKIEKKNINIYNMHVKR